MKATDRA